MSVSASIDFKLYQVSQVFSTVRTIKRLVDFGWTFRIEGQTTYLPIGDDGDYDWLSRQIDNQSLIEILNQKEQKGELVGLVMTWKDTCIGGEFLFWKDGTISISLSINRKLVNDDDMLEITDVTWYLTKLLPVLQVESFTFTEYK